MDVLSTSASVLTRVCCQWHCRSCTGSCFGVACGLRKTPETILSIADRPAPVALLLLLVVALQVRVTHCAGADPCRRRDRGLSRVGPAHAGHLEYPAQRQQRCNMGASLTSHMYVCAHEPAGWLVWGSMHPPDEQAVCGNQHTHKTLLTRAV